MLPSGSTSRKRCSLRDARADRAAARLAAAVRGQRGLPRIGFVAQGAGETGTEILRRFAEKFPAIETELMEPPRSRVTSGSSAAGGGRGFAMHPRHRFASQRAVRPEELLDEPIVAHWDHLSEATLAYWLAPFRTEGARAI